MTTFKFTSGTIEKLCFDYYNLTLFNNGVQIYKATIERLDAAELIDKYDNQKIKFIQ